MGRGGASKDRSDGPERKCIATGDVQPKHGLIRFVVGPDAQIVPDIAGKLPGRGIYVAADRVALDKSVEKKLFARGAKQAVQVADDLVAEVERQLARRVIDLIALSRKSGRAVAGDEKVKGMSAPIKYYTPSIAPSGLIYYAGKKHKDLKGALISGALAMTHLNIYFPETKKEMRLFEDKGMRVRTVSSDESGDIYFSVDKGQIYKLVNE